MIGTIILTVTQGVFFDVTGGVLTGVGVLLAGGVLVFKKGKIIRQFEQGLDAGKRQFKLELTERLAARLKIVYEDIDRSFIEFYDYVNAEEKESLPLLERFGQNQEKYKRLSNSLR